MPPKIGPTFPAAIAFLHRGVDLLRPEDPRRTAALSSLGQALLGRGEFARAGEALRAAASAAATTGDRAGEIRAQLLLGSIAWRTGTTASTEIRLAEVLEVVPELQELGDLATLALAYATIGTSRFVLGRAAEGEADLERAAELARQAGEVSEELRALNALLRPKLWGPAPAETLLALCDEILGRGDVNPRLRIHALEVRSVAAALLDDDAGARDVGRLAGTLIEEYGLPLQGGLYAIDFGFALELAGDLRGAEDVLRRGREVIQPLGDTGVLASLSGELANVLARRERLDEAETFASESRSVSADDDFDAQTRWRNALARVHLLRGELEEAERLAREAVTVASRTDFITLGAEAERVLGEALAARGRPSEAEAAFKRALELYDRKGNVVGAREVRALLEAATTPS